MSRNPFTGRGSNISPDDDHAQKCDREREAEDTRESHRLAAEDDGVECESAELTACGIANRGLDTERFSSSNFKDQPGGVESAHLGRRADPPDLPLEMPAHNL